MTRNAQLGTLGMPVIPEDTRTAPMAGVHGYGTPAQHGTATSLPMPPMPGWGAYSPTGMPATIPQPAPYAAARAVEPSLAEALYRLGSNMGRVRYARSAY